MQRRETKSNRTKYRKELIREASVESSIQAGLEELRVVKLKKLLLLATSLLVLVVVRILVRSQSKSNEKKMVMPS